MTTPSPKEITQLLIDWSGGERSALNELMPLVHAELRRLAHHYMSGNGPATLCKPPLS